MYNYIVDLFNLYSIAIDSINKEIIYINLVNYIVRNLY